MTTPQTGDGGRYEAVIGLEVHVQLATASKIFCGCSTRFGAPPNSQICPVCSGQPGVLPLLNARVIEYALKMALATGCEIRRSSRFARKNYFYPDLPKGYQISQYEQPLAEHGAVQVPAPDAPDGGEILRVGITRIHLEEDAGKTIHQGAGGGSLVDLNRAGVPLIEIVSEPDLRTPASAAETMRTIRGIVRTLGISDGNMQEGSLRCDANVSLRPLGSEPLGTKAEIKNLNSFRFVQKALEYEIERQRALLESGGRVVQETRLYDADRGVTVSMRSKEEADDYRYFPEPDLPPVEIDAAWIERLRAELPELPLTRRLRLASTHGLSDADAAALTRERELADYFEQAVAAGARPKPAANWMLGELLSRVADPRDVLQSPVGPAGVAELLSLVESGKISGKLAKQIWSKMWDHGGSARQIAEQDDLFQQSDAGALEAEVKKVIDDNPDGVAQYRAGKTKLLGFFVGKVMKATRGKANPQLVNELLRKVLDDG